MCKVEKLAESKICSSRGHNTKIKMDMASARGSSSHLIVMYMKQLKNISHHPNLLLCYQDEVGSKHWDHEQITLHPTSILFKCITCNDYVHKEAIHITLDKTHEHKAVQQFIQTTLHHLEQKGVELKEIIEFTDHISCSISPDSISIIYPTWRYLQQDITLVWSMIKVHLIELE